MVLECFLDNDLAKTFSKGIIPLRRSLNEFVIVGTSQSMFMNCPGPAARKLLCLFPSNELNHHQSTLIKHRSICIYRPFIINRHQITLRYPSSIITISHQIFIIRHQSPSTINRHYHSSIIKLIHESLNNQASTIASRQSS